MDGLVYCRLLHLLLPLLAGVHLSSAISPINATEVHRNMTMLLDSLLNGYDSRLRPNFGGKAVEVVMGIYIRSMGPVSELDFTYLMDCYFRQTWNDPRLTFNGTIPVLSLNIKMLEQLWKPDTYFYNGKKSYLHEITTPNKLLRIKQDGTVVYSMRLTIKADCPMNLKKFPMDTQACPLRIGSYGYSDSDVIYQWRQTGDPIDIEPGMIMSQFDLVGTPSSNYTHYFKRGSFSMLLVRFKLRRHMGYFLIQVYVPCSLVVMLSWVGFWINREATGDRITLGVTTVLTMAFLALESRTDLPKVSYSTALDYYVGLCAGFVFSTIFQFAGVHYFTKQASGEVYPELNSDFEEIAPEEEVPSDVEDNEAVSNLDKDTAAARSTLAHTSREDESTKKEKKSSCFARFFCQPRYQTSGNHLTDDEGFNSVSCIDKSSRIFFPLTFFLINISYWASYLKDRDEILDAELI